MRCWCGGCGSHRQRVGEDGPRTARQRGRLKGHGKQQRHDRSASLDEHAARIFDALRVNPTVAAGKQRCDRTADVVRQPHAAERGL